MSVYDRIMAYIEQNNMTMYRFEKMAGLTRSSVSNWKTSTPSFDNLKKAADLMGVTPEFLMTGESPQSKDDYDLPDDVADLLVRLDTAPSSIRKAAIAAAIAVLNTTDSN